MPDPISPVVEDFNDTEGPPMTGWTDLLNGVRSNGSTGQSNSGQSVSYYSAGGTKTNRCEAYATMSTKPAASGTFSVMLLQDVATVLTIDGYEGRITVGAGGADDTWRIYRISNGAATQLATATQEAANGDGIWLENKNGLLNLYRRSAGTWSQITSASDTTHTGDKYLILGLGDTTARAEDFGGGAIPAGQAWYAHAQQQ